MSRRMTTVILLTALTIGGGVAAFIARAQKIWPVRKHPSNSITLSLRDMPKTPEVVFLEGY